VAATHWRKAKEFIGELAAKPRFGLVSDLDGTLSHIAPTPEEAQITTRNRELLSDLQDELSLVAIISGRRADSLHERIGIPGLIYVGNHGLERWVDGEIQIITEAKPYLSNIQSVKKELQKITETGIYVEDKGPTLSLHYRKVEKPVAFGRNIAARIAELAGKHGLEVFTGKMVFEIRPPVSMDKGIAFQQLVKEKGIEAALFLGDDVSDLSAFQVARKMRAESICDAWGIGVQSEEAPEDLAATADFLAEGVEDVEDLLSWLLRACRASST
jgi:trehalose 6-phosphate phosphatase